MTDNVPTPHPEDQQDTYTDLTARLAAADLGWSHEHGDPPASPDYIRWLAWQAEAFEPRPVSQGTEDGDYREQMAEVLHAAAVDVPGTPQVGPALIERQIAALWPRVSPLVEQLRQARATAESISKRTDMFKQTYNRMAKHAAGLAAERDRLRLAWQSAARGRRRARVERDTARNQFLDHYNGTAGQLDRILELQDALRERTGQRDEVRAEADRLSHELGQHRRVERDAYERHRTALVAALGDVPHKSLIALIEDDVRELRADLETRTCERDYARAELAAVGRAIECYLGVEYGTPVESARALVERCADAESALDGLRTTAVVLPEDWRQMLADGDYPEQVVDLIESWRAAPVLPVTPDEHVREHDDAAPTRDEVVEEWADTWDGVDRTPEWVRVVEPCPVPECTIPQVHGHEGYGLRFTPAAQPEPQGEPDEDWCGRFADDGKHYCPEGHNTVYQMFSGGREWYCADCGTQGTYPPAPADVGPRARLLTQSGGAAELKRQMDKHLASPGTGTEAGE